MPGLDGAVTPAGQEDEVAQAYPPTWLTSTDTTRPRHIPTDTRGIVKAPVLRRWASPVSDDPSCPTAMDFQGVHPRLVRDRAERTRPTDPLGL